MCRGCVCVSSSVHGFAFNFNFNLILVNLKTFSPVTNVFTFNADSDDGAVCLYVCVYQVFDNGSKSTFRVDFSNGIFSSFRILWLHFGIYLPPSIVNIDIKNEILKLTHSLTLCDMYFIA